MCLCVGLLCSQVFYSCNRSEATSRYCQRNGCGCPHIGFIPGNQQQVSNSCRLSFHTTVLHIFVNQTCIISWSCLMPAVHGMVYVCCHWNETEVASAAMKCVLPLMPLSLGGLLTLLFWCLFTFLYLLYVVMCWCMGVFSVAVSCPSQHQDGSRHRGLLTHWVWVQQIEVSVNKIPSDESLH